MQPPNIGWSGCEPVQDAAPAEELHATVQIPTHAITPTEDRWTNKDVLQVPLPVIGSSVGKYRLDAVCGIGSSSVVFRATHRTLDIPVALKFLNRRHVYDRVAILQHLRNEAQLLAHINHPNVVRIWDFEDNLENAHLVTEYVDGPTLGVVMKEHKRMEPKLILRIVLQIIRALEELWELRIVHRDVKPDNILICMDGTAKLIDLGLAVIAGRDNPWTQAVPITTPWVGTPIYLAPEQAKSSSRVDHRADMYSLGITLYHAITGRPPFEGKNLMQILLKHLEDNPTPPHEVVPDLCPILSGIIVRMLSKKPDQRFASYADLRAALQMCL